MNSVVDLLKTHEGLRLKAYECTAGKLTIGYGHNIEAHPIPGRTLQSLKEHGIDAEYAEALLIEDIQRCIRQLETIDEFQVMDEVRRAAIIDLCFNLGFAGLLQFKRMWQAIERKDWVAAAKEAKDSRWYRQVGWRGPRIVGMLEYGCWP